MERLISRFFAVRNDIKYIGFIEGEKFIENIKNYTLVPMRNKYNKYLSCFLIPYAIFYNSFKMILLILKYQPKGIISTGPGSVLFPAIICKLFRIKIIYIETSSRFYTKSLTGKIMYFFADKFYVQNAELLDLYPNSVYSGLL